MIEMAIIMAVITFLFVAALIIDDKFFLKKRTFKYLKRKRLDYENSRIGK